MPGPLPGVLEDGAAPSLPSFDGAVLNLPSFDGGIVLPALPEAGLSLPAGFDAGLALPADLDAGFALPSGFDGGLPSIGNLLGDAGLSTTGVPGGDCVRNLNSCATSGTALTDCAEQARTCLEKRLMAP
ncbi:MAG: hypothetical protein RL385_3352 [Pseudomonadota bacterium]